MKNLLIGLALIFCASLSAQRNAENDYWNSWRYTPKQGMTTEFEKAVAKKMQMFNNSAETGMITYKIITGRNSGTYERVESMKYPKDYDMDRTAEGDYWQKNVSKFVEKTSGQMRWDRINNATLNWDPENPGTPSKYLKRTTFDVKPSGTTHFRRFISRITKTMKKREFKDKQLMFRCISGGSDNMYIMVRGWDRYQDQPWSESDNTFEEDYNEQFGWGTFEEDRNNFNNSLESWGEMTESMELVPSLTTGMMN
ncbi:MAG: hypothetical protein V7719_17700 [Psychroserpens sp.]|uniref:hypothetical protein n=1 Tax=Psychroserpens sp. TaxID=2020870 RepID=UPI003002E30E